MKVFTLFTVFTVIFSIFLQNEALKLENAQPRMTYVGEAGGKYYYFQDIEVNRDVARTACSNAGMEMAYFDSLNEFDFISSIGPILRFWTSAIHPNSLGYFTWEHDGGSEIPSQNFAYFTDTELGLTYNNEPDSEKGLTQTLRSHTAYPLCISSTPINENILPKATNPKENPKITKEKIITKRPSFESGPLPVSVKLANPRMEYIGEFNGRSFYYDPQLVGRNESKTICESSGMQMAYFESAAEIEFIFVNSPQNYFWVSGIKRWDDSTLSYFQWEKPDSVIPDDIPFNSFPDTSLGLLFSGYLEEFPRHFIQTKLDYANAMPLCFVLG